jgi:hypothetical protein
MRLKVRMRMSLALSVVDVVIAGARTRTRKKGKPVLFVADDRILYHFQIENGLDQLERGLVGVKTRHGIECWSEIHSGWLAADWPGCKSTKFEIEP